MEYLLELVYRVIYEIAHGMLICAQVKVRLAELPLAPSALWRLIDAAPLFGLLIQRSLWTQKESLG